MPVIHPVLIADVRHQLGSKAKQVHQRKDHLSKTAGGSWNRADLGDPGKWSLGDIKQFGQVLVKFSDDLAVLKEQREQIDQEIRSLKSGMLKGALLLLAAFYLLG